MAAPEMLGQIAGRLPLAAIEYAAHIRSMPESAVPIWSRPSQFCNRMSTCPAAGADIWAVDSGFQCRNSSGNHTARFSAKQLGKSWRFFPTYAEV
jgi:hypothetical protein